jgi:hypothetical protein
MYRLTCAFDSRSKILAMIREITKEDIAELRAEADDARHLASALDDAASMADLFEYAASLEADAASWELVLLSGAEAA